MKGTIESVINNRGKILVTDSCPMKSLYFGPSELLNAELNQDLVGKAVTFHTDNDRATHVRVTD